MTKHPFSTPQTALDDGARAAVPPPPAGLSPVAVTYELQLPTLAATFRQLLCTRLGPFLLLPAFILIIYAVIAVAKGDDEVRSWAAALVPVAALALWMLLLLRQATGAPFGRPGELVRFELKLEAAGASLETKHHRSSLPWDGFSHYQTRPGTVLLAPRQGRLWQIFTVSLTEEENRDVRAWIAHYLDDRPPAAPAVVPRRRVGTVALLWAGFIGGFWVIYRLFGR